MVPPVIFTLPTGPKLLIPITPRLVKLPTDVMFGWVAVVTVAAVPAEVAYVAFATVPLTLAPATELAVPAVVAVPAEVAYVAFATVPETLAPATLFAVVA